MNNIAIPKRIKVGGFTYRIEQGPMIDMNLTARSARAECSNDELIIRVATNIPAQLRHDAFVHELLHAVDAVYCGGRALSEEYTQTMSHGMTQVLEQLGVRFV